MANTHYTLQGNWVNTACTEKHRFTRMFMTHRVELIGSLSLSQGGVGFSGHHAPGVGCVDRPLWARADRPRGGSAVCSVRRPPCGVGRLRLHGEGVGPWDGGVSTYTAGTHQQSVLATGKQLLMLLCGQVFRKSETCLNEGYCSILTSFFLSLYSLMVSLWWAAHWTLQSESGTQRPVQTCMCQINFICSKFIKCFVMMSSFFFSNILSLLYHWHFILTISYIKVRKNKTNTKLIKKMYYGYN